MIDSFEKAHHDWFIAALEVDLPAKTWRTPDGQWWTPQQVLHGWKERLSDRWACIKLHQWCVTDAVTIRHVGLPTPLLSHDPTQPAWKFIASLGTSGIEPEREPSVTFGRADLVVTFDDDDSSLWVEFGSCSPVKFVLNLGTSIHTDWMIVPYGCPYAFVFTANEPCFQATPIEFTRRLGRP